MANYDLELQKAIEKIKKTNAKLVCIQLPDGLKPQAKEITDTIEAQTDAKVLIWLGSCYGACDWPLGIDKLGVDLLIAWGHSVWKHDTFDAVAEKVGEYMPQPLPMPSPARSYTSVDVA